MKEEKALTAATETFPSLESLPDLSQCEVAPIELVGEYWSPQEEGETRRVFFYDFSTQYVIEPATGESRDLNIVRFVEQTPSGYRLICNGSARLVGQFEQMARELERGMPFSITYMGKKKTNTGRSADSWSVKRIFIK